MNCDLAQKIIDEAPTGALHDLDPEVDEHVKSCDSCAAALRLRSLASARLAATGRREQAGTDFTRRLLRAIDGEADNAPARRAVSPPAKPSFWRALLRPSPVWAAAALVLVLVSGYNYMRTLGYFSPAGEMPADMGVFVHDVGHDAYLYTRDSQTLEIVSNDPSRVRDWFAPRVDFPVSAPARLSGGFEMQGARLWHTVSRLSAFVCYQTEAGERISLFVISADNLADTGARKIRRGGRTYHAGESFQFNVVSWRRGESAYALVGKLPVETLLDVAEDFTR